VSCTPQDFLSLAIKLSSSAEEIERRAGVSRAYYGAFHIADQAKGILPELPYQEVGFGSHEAVVRRYLADRGNKPSVKLGYILRDMKNRRESADYDLSGQCPTEDVMVQIGEARKIEELARLLAK
jgi:uncharacterized protein (UPF0332 family)